MSTDTPQFAVDHDDNGPMIVLNTPGVEPDMTMILVEKYDLMHRVEAPLVFAADRVKALAAIDALWERLTAGLPTLRRDGERGTEGAGR